MRWKKIARDDTRDEAVVRIRRTPRWEYEEARSGGRAYGGRYEAVVQGMELPDVGVEIAGRRRQIGVAQPERHGVHWITGFELPGPGLVPEIMEPKMRNARPSATGVMRTMLVPYASRGKP